MLRREEELRLSEEVQEQYAAVEVDDSDLDWMHITDALQRRVVREFGATSENEGEALAALRRAAREDHDFTPLYVRYQRARQGDLHAGSEVVECPLLKLDGTPTTLLSETATTSTSCVLAGSYS